MELFCPVSSKLQENRVPPLKIWIFFCRQMWNTTEVRYFIDKMFRKIEYTPQNDNDFESGRPKPFQCTMQKLTNWVQSGKVWQINSPTIFSENYPNFQWWCLNIQIFDKVIPFQNFWEKKVVEIAKNLLGVLSQDNFGVKKIV